MLHRKRSVLGLFHWNFGKVKQVLFIFRLSSHEYTSLSFGFSLYTRQKRNKIKWNKETYFNRCVMMMSLIITIFNLRKISSMTSSIFFRPWEKNFPSRWICFLTVQSIWIKASQQWRDVVQEQLQNGYAPSKFKTKITIDIALFSFYFFANNKFRADWIICNISKCFISNGFFL